MNKIAVTVAVLALGLAACKQDNEENAGPATKRTSRCRRARDVNAATTDAPGNAADNAPNAAGNAIDDAGAAVDNAGNAVDQRTVSSNACISNSEKGSSFGAALFLWPLKVIRHAR